MCECKENGAIALSRPPIWCLALVALLCPIGAGMAWGQTSLSITVLLVSCQDDPDDKVKPTAEVQSFDQESSTADTSEKSSHSSAANAQEIQGESQPTVELEKQLSVRPLSSLLPADRPAWITDEADYSGSTHLLVVASVPTTRESDLDANLNASLEESVRSYIEEQWKDGYASEKLRHKLSAEFIRKNFLDNKHVYVAQLETSSGPMFQKWVRLEITDKQREQLQHWYRERVQRDRLIPVGVLVGGLAGFLGICHLTLRRMASKATDTDQRPEVSPAAVSKKLACCGKKARFGYLFAIAVAIIVASFIS
jgi:hypothetical protein